MEKVFFLEKVFLGKVFFGIGSGSASSDQSAMLYLRNPQDHSDHRAKSGKTLGIQAIWVLGLGQLMDHAPR